MRCVRSLIIAPVSIMLSEYICPLCASNDWQPIRQYHYHATDQTHSSIIGNDRMINRIHYCKDAVRAFFYAAPKPYHVRERLLTSYEKLRREVLFSLWFPDQRDVIITTQYCRHCGFMSYRPRPEEADIDAKYRMLGERSTPEEIEEYNAHLDTDPYANRSRAHINNLITDGLQDMPQRILDCGGASGWYLVPFADQGCICDLVDYETGQLTGIRKIGDDVRELNSTEVYNAIVCRAVMEHLADPLSVARQFKRLLKDNGLVYAMVPGEIYAGVARLGYDPVTHVNFFTPYSFKSMFCTAGFEIAAEGTDEMGNIWILARKKGHTNCIINPKSMDITTYLYPRRRNTLKKYVFDRLRRALLK